MGRKVFIVFPLRYNLLDVVQPQLFRVELSIEFVGIGYYQSGANKSVNFALKEIASELLEEFGVVEDL